MAMAEKSKQTAARSLWASSIPVAWPTLSGALAAGRSVALTAVTPGPTGCMTEEHDLGMLGPLHRFLTCLQAPVHLRTFKGKTAQDGSR